MIDLYFKMIKKLKSWIKDLFSTQKLNTVLESNMVDIEDVADMIISYCKLSGYKINHMRLHKLLYFVQAWHIARFNKNPLFKDLPEAWTCGPIYRKIYNKYKEKFFMYDSF